MRGVDGRKIIVRRHQRVENWLKKTSKTKILDKLLSHDSCFKQIRAIGYTCEIEEDRHFDQTMMFQAFVN